MAVSGNKITEKLRALKEYVDKLRKADISYLETIYDGENGEYTIYQVKTQRGETSFPSAKYVNEITKAITLELLNQPAYTDWYEEFGALGSVTIMLTDVLQVVHTHHKRVHMFDTTTEFHALNS